MKTSNNSAEDKQRSKLEQPELESTEPVARGCQYRTVAGSCDCVCFICLLWPTLLLLGLLGWYTADYWQVYAEDLVDMEV